MDRRERMNDRLESLRTMLDGRQAEIWTALPAFVVSFDRQKVTCVAQPTIQGTQLMPDGSSQWITISNCLDVPVLFPSGGGFIFAHDVKEGDEGLLVFSSRCIDAWWQSGGIQTQAELRMHDLSDGFFLPGVFSQPNVPAGQIEEGKASMRTLDNATFIEMDLENNINMKADGKITLTTPELHVTGKITTEDEVVADGEVTGNDIKLSEHIHGGVDTGSDDTEGPSNP